MAKGPRWGKLAKKVRKAPLRLLLALRHRTTPAERVLVLDLESHYRFGPFLMAAFAGKGYAVEVVKRGAFVPDPRMMARMGIGMVSVSRAAACHPDKTLIHDAEVGSPRIPGPWRRTVRLDYDYYRKRPSRGFGADELFGPFFMHPKVYEAGVHDEVRSMRRSHRPIRVFFAGTVAGYDTDRDFHWPYPTRAQVIEAAIESFPADIEYIRATTDKQAFLESPHALVLAVTRETSDTVDKHLLSQLEMLRFAGASDFFINPPGLSHPHSHNVIEAMAAGAIPILAYGEHFQPALVDMETCIAYRDVPEFLEKLRGALEMPEDEIRRMRENVCRYYDEHLAPDAFFRAWTRLDAPTATLRIHNSNVVSRPEYAGVSDA